MTTKVPTGVKAAVKIWANKIAVDDNDMIYLRKKNGILYAMKVKAHEANTWEQLDPLDVPVVVDIHGEALARAVGNLPDSTIEALKTPKRKSIPKIALGWYQDDQANLFKYEGKGVWDTLEKDWEKLLNLADSGMLEYIG